MVLSLFIGDNEVYVVGNQCDFDLTMWVVAPKSSANNLMRVLMKFHSKETSE